MNKPTLNENWSLPIELNSPKSFSMPKECFYSEHGGQAHLIPQEIFKAKHWVDFSASINPLGPSKNIEQVFGDSLTIISRYPDPQSSELKQALSKYLETEENRLVISNGATELIYLLPHLIKRGQEVLVLVPVFSEYLRAFKLSKVPVRTLAYDIGKGFEPPIEKLLDSIKKNPKIDAVVIGHPNSPTGCLWDERHLRVLAEYCEDKGKLLIVDETFIDFCPGGTSVSDQFKNFRHLISIRSMTKFFALPGMRLGYGVMDSKWVEKIKKFQSPWSVNGLAQAFGMVSLKDKSFIQHSRSFAHEQREFLFKHLWEMPGLKAYSSDANFILFRLKGRQETLPKRFYYHLLQEGILLRNCGNFEGLDETYFRIGVRNNDDNKLLLSKMKQYLSSRDIQ